MTPIDYSGKSGLELRISELENESIELQIELEKYEGMRATVEALLDTMTATTATDTQLDILREIVRER